MPFVSVLHTSSNRLLLSNQDKGCTPCVAHSLPLPLGPALLNLWTDASRLVPHIHVPMLQAYTIDEVAQQLEHPMSFAPSCVVIHEITKDVKSGQSAKAIAEYFQSVVDYYSTKYPQTKFVISLGVCRVDNQKLYTITEVINAHLKGFVNSEGNSGNVTFCDHGNFTRNGNPELYLLSKRDEYHLSNEGIKLLCSNVRCGVEKVLNIQSRYRQKIQITMETNYHHVNKIL